MKFPYKIAIIIALVAVLMTMTLSGSVVAGSTAKALSTNYTLVNLGSTEASVNVDYMKSDGSTWTADPGNTSFKIPANYGINQVRQYFDTTLQAGQGSVVVSSNQSLGAIVQIMARNQTPSQGAYTGYSAGSNKFYVPLAAKKASTSSGIANSQIIIQNVDSSNFTVTVDLYKGATKTYTKTSNTLIPGQSFYYDLADESDANLPAGWVGSAVVTGGNSGKIAVVSNFFTGPDAMQTFNGFAAENVGSKWAAPLFFARLANGLSTVVTVQNLSGGTLAAGTVSLNCTRDTTGTALDTFTVHNPANIADKAAYSFNPVTDKTLFPTDKWGGSCQLDAGTGHNVVVIVQMRYVIAGNAGAATYEAINATATGGKTMVVPLIAKRLGNGFASVVTIQNMDLDAQNGQAASVTLTYTPSFNASECPIAACDINHDGKVNASDKIVVGPLSIPPAASIQRNHRVTSGKDAETTLPSSWQGSLVVVSTTSNINGFVQLTNFLNNTGDTFMAHGVFVLP